MSPLKVFAYRQNCLLVLVIEVMGESCAKAVSIQGFLSTCISILITESYYHQSWYCTEFPFASIPKGARTNIYVFLGLKLSILKVLIILFITPRWFILNDIILFSEKGEFQYQKCFYVINLDLGHLLFLLTALLLEGIDRLIHIFLFLGKPNKIFKIY